jgi:hypothetical protein
MRIPVVQIMTPNNYGFFWKLLIPPFFGHKSPFLPLGFLSSGFISSAENVQIVLRYFLVDWVGP